MTCGGVGFHNIDVYGSNQEKNVAHVDINYPRNSQFNILELDLIDVRATDGLRVFYNFTMDAWVVQQPSSKLGENDNFVRTWVTVGIFHSYELGDSDKLNEEDYKVTKGLLSVIDPEFKYPSDVDLLKKYTELDSVSRARQLDEIACLLNSEDLAKIKNKELKLLTIRDFSNNSEEVVLQDINNPQNRRVIGTILPLPLTVLD